ncbi:hypothetical protein MAR_030989 [Mya arenaria]|uniref:C-type lectin domain-containing protein n=1 Tax=Mya arenaria TaxID=6604 RepID=A0ABY7F2K4_MYAAR|nr:hypothetical protein MAR_030989 [Mya arenaria]
MSNYTRLIQREPNSNALNIREDCLVYWAHYSWKWADLDCHQKCYFVCEMPNLVQKDMPTTEMAVQYQVGKAVRNLCFHRFEYYVLTGVYNK